MHGLFRS